MKRPFKQRVRTVVIRKTAGAMNWVSDTVVPLRLGCPITWRDHLRWFLEARLSAIFLLAYNGSDEEITAVYEAEIPPYAMSARQRAELCKHDPAGISALCINYGCRWRGTYTQAVADNCPQCGAHVHLLPIRGPLIHECGTASLRKRTALERLLHPLRRVRVSRSTIGGAA